MSRGLDMMRTIATLACVAVALTACKPASAEPARAGQCFRSHDYQGFHAINDSSFYIRVSVDTFYRIDLAAPCPTLTYPDARLITVIHGSDYICGPLDWQLQVAETLPSIPVGCVVQKQTRLTAAEAAAIPPKLRP